MSSTKRQALREKALATKPPRSQIVDVAGDKYEVVQPNLHEREEIFRRAGALQNIREDGEIDLGKVSPLALQVWAAIFCTYVPRDQEEERQGVERERVYEPDDFALLCAANPGHPVEKLGPVALSLIGAASNTEDAKNA